MRGTWQTTHGVGPVVLVAVAVVLVLAAAAWVAARIWWIIGGTLLLGVLAAAAVLWLMRWSDRRAAAMFAARPVYQLPPEPRPRLEASGRPAIGPGRAIHFHLNVTPEQLAAIVRHYTEED